jgi:DNA invertase Pin-like site-specific DNA recombinase
MAKDWVNKRKQDGFYLDSHIIKDLGISGRHEANLDPEIGALGTFIQQVKNGEIERGSYLIIEKLDRFSRASPQRMGGIIGELVEIHEINIVILHPAERVITADTINKIDVTILISLELQMAFAQSEEKSYRLGKVWERKRREIADKVVVSKALPDWLYFSETTSTIEPVSDKTKAIEYLFEQTINGVGQYTLTKQMNSLFKPISNPRKGNEIPKWTSSYISKLLRDRRLLGEYQCHKITYEKERHEGKIKNKRKRVPEGDPIKGYFPRVISDDVFYKAQSAKADRYKWDRFDFSHMVNLFTGLVYNAYTGNKMIIQSTKTKRSDGSTYIQKRLIDYSAKNGIEGACPWTVEYFQLESLLLDAISEINLTMFSQTVDAVSQERRSLEETLSGIRSQISDLDNQFKDPKHLRSRNRILSLLDQLEEDKHDCLQRLKVLETLPSQSREEVTEGLRNLKHFLLSGSKEEEVNKKRRLKKIIAYLVERIEIMPLKRTNNTVSAVGAIRFVNGEERRFHLYKWKQCPEDGKILVTDKNAMPLFMVTKHGSVFYKINRRGREIEHGVSTIKMGCVFVGGKRRRLTKQFTDLYSKLTMRFKQDLKTSRKWGKVDMKKLLGYSSAVPSDVSAVNQVESDHE